ncbi:hypothetical protein POM88_000100 [Heracleum sosnowskyi]|uniref:Uncharacterized protein n=1 Tax=Heracleum sosnowskyi TaxID=360622 RepID=A0AAD8JDJ9_9APIA|nr:hypothetical protein POM88_000100 [Heracleum sosnowskyi]
MKTNLKSYNKWKLKRKLEANDDGQAKHSRGGGYMEDLRKSEVCQFNSSSSLNRDYPAPWIVPRLPGERLQFPTGGCWVAKIYDSSHSTNRCERIQVDNLLCYSRLAMAFYNIGMGTDFRVVKLLMATRENSRTYPHYITFEAERNTGGSDSTLDTQYSLALYLSQFALLSYNSHVLKRFVVAKHDIESLKVLKLVKPDSEKDKIIVPRFLLSIQTDHEFRAYYKSDYEIAMIVLLIMPKIPLVVEL